MTALLTQQLEASVSFERCKIRIEQLQRAQKYLYVAREAARRYVNRMRMVEGFDRAKSNYEPWTLIETKEELMKRANRNWETHDRCMKSYRQIIVSML